MIHSKMIMKIWKSNKMIEIVSTRILLAAKLVIVWDQMLSNQ